MKLLFFGMIVLMSAVASGFLGNTEFKALKSGCAGANCHQYFPGFVSLKPQNNLKILVEPAAQVNSRFLSAELIDQQGRVVDFQKIAGREQLILNAPKPGKYKVLIGYLLNKPYWDSLSVTVEPSVVSIPTSRYGAVTFKLFPIHPNPARSAVVSRFILSHNSNATLTLYSAAGKKVKTIYNGSLSAGLHTIYWKTRDDFRRPLPPGSYLCELRSGSRKLVERVFIEG